MQVWSLVRALISHMPHNQGKVPQKSFYKSFNTWVVKGKPVYMNRFDLYMFASAYSLPEMLILAVAIPSRWVTLSPGRGGRDGKLSDLLQITRLGKACRGVWTQGRPLWRSHSVLGTDIHLLSESVFTYWAPTMCQALENTAVNK